MNNLSRSHIPEFGSNLGASSNNNQVFDLSRSIIPSGPLRAIEDEVVLSQFLLIKVPPIEQQYKKQFELHVTGHTLNDILAVTNNGNNIDANRLMGVAGKILMPSGSSEILNLPNANDACFVFVMELMVTTLQKVVREVIVGFTDNVGMSHSGFLDPNMRLYISSITHFKQGFSVTSDKIYRPTFDSARQVIAGQQDILDGQSMVMLRPVDVVNNASNSEYQQVVDLLLDQTFIVDGSPKTSNHMHLSPHKYMADLFAAYRLTSYNNLYNDVDHSFSEPEFFGLDYKKAIGILNNSEVSFQQSYLYKSLLRPNRLMQNFITIAMVNGAWSVPDNFVKVLVSKNTNNYFDYESWKIGTMESRIAYHILQAVPTIMMKYMCSSVYFNITNMVIGSNPVSAITNATSFFKNAIDANVLSLLEQELRNIIGDVIVAPKVAEYNIFLNANILEVSTLSISINGDAPVPFAMPTYAEAFMSPISSNNHKTLDGLANMSLDVITSMNFASGIL